MAAHERGDFEQSQAHIQRSLFLAEATSDCSLIARVRLGLFRVCAESVTSGEFVIADVRKAVVNSGDAHLFADLRLHFARAEASRHSLQEARVHLLAAEGLLQRSPNVWLSRPVRLGLSLVDMLCGDPRSAMTHAQSAIECARESVTYEQNWQDV